MTTPHVHSELIKAWADGAEIQHENKSAKSGWSDCSSQPEWHPGRAYRIKPKPVTVRYRVALMVDGVQPAWTETANDDADAKDMETSRTCFVRWLDTDWQEVEA